MENSQSHYTRSEFNKSDQSLSSGQIIRQKEPNNLETPVDRVDSFLTPTELFYVRSHSPAPKLEPASYRLQIDGAFRKSGEPLFLLCGYLCDVRRLRAGGLIRRSS
jgi:hypothetical protein